MSLRGPDWGGAILTQSIQSTVWTWYHFCLHFNGQSKSYSHLTSRSQWATLDHQPTKKGEQKFLNGSTNAHYNQDDQLSSFVRTKGFPGMQDSQSRNWKSPGQTRTSCSPFLCRVTYSLQTHFSMTAPTVHLVDESWFFSLIPYCWRLRLFPVLHVYKSTALIASWIKSCSYSFSEVQLLASFQAQNAHCPSIFQKSLEQHDLPSTAKPRSTPEHSPGALGSHSPIFAAESPSC